MKAIADFPTTSSSTLPPDSYSFDYTLGITLWLTRADIDLLILCAKHHYDRTCQGLGLAIDERSEKTSFKALHNGRLVILRDAYLSTDGERTPAHLDQREIDTMLKILGIVPPLLGLAPSVVIDQEHAGALFRRLKEAFHAINAEYYRLRKETKSQPFSKEPQSIISAGPDDGR